MEEKPSTSGRAPRGRPKRNLVKTTISMNAEAMALWFKAASLTSTPQIIELERAIREHAAHLNVTVTPDEVRELTGAEVTP